MSRVTLPIIALARAAAAALAAAAPVAIASAGPPSNPSACWVFCPRGAGADSEGCGPRTNDGCSGAPVMFEALAAGATVCGTLWDAGGDLDEDWYELQVTSDTQLVITITSTLPIEAGLAATGGVPQCRLAGALDPAIALDSCGRGTLYACVGPGTWWLVIRSPSGLPTCDTTPSDYWVMLHAAAPGDLKSAGASAEAILDALPEVGAADDDMVAQLDNVAIPAANAMNAQAVQLGNGLAQAAQQTNGCGPPASMAKQKLLEASSAAFGVADTAGEQRDQMDNVKVLAQAGKEQIELSQGIWELFHQQLAVHDVIRAISKGMDALEQEERHDAKDQAARDELIRMTEKHLESGVQLTLIGNDMNMAAASLSTLGPCAQPALAMIANMQNLLAAAQGNQGNIGAAIGVVTSDTSVALNTSAAIVGHAHHALAVLQGCDCPDCPYCAGDLNLDRVVDGADLGLLLSAWSTPLYDLDSSGSVDGGDLGILLAAWGPC